MPTHTAPCPPGAVQVRRALYNNEADIAAAIEEMMAHLPAVAALTPLSRVMLKPNLLAKHAPDTGITTHPFVVKGVIAALQRRGVTQITIAESPAGPYTPAIMEGIYAACGITDICRQTGVQMYTACQTALLPTPKGSLVRQFTAIQPVFECDLLINLPKVKTHVMTGLSGAVKNLFGCVAGLHKVELHMQFPEKQHFGQMLVDLQRALPPAIHIADGTLAMEGDGPSGGVARQLNLLWAGDDPFMLDLCLCRYIGLAPMQVPYLAAAHQNGLCPAAFDGNALAAQDETTAKPIPDFAQPRSYTGRLDFSHHAPFFMRPIVPLLQRWASPTPVIRKKHCIGCGKCAGMCPQKVITVQKGKAHIQYQNCIRCFCCHEICPVHCIKVRKRNIFGA